MTATAVVEDRTQFIGGSDVAAILGLDPYKTRLQVYEEKIGEGEPFEGNHHTRRGQRLEEIAAEEYMTKHGVKLVRVNTRIVNPRYPFITARIDRRVVGSRKLVEFKVPSLGSYSKMKREGLHEGYIAQMHSYLGTTEFEAGDWGIFNADMWDLTDFEVEHDAKLVSDIEHALAAFWIDHVLQRVPPPADEADIERLEIKRAEGSKEVFEVKDPALMEAIINLRDAKLIAKEAEEIEEDAKARIREITNEKLGIYKVAGGVKLTYYGSKGRSSFDKKHLVANGALDPLTAGQVILSSGKNIGLDDDTIASIAQRLGTEARLDLSKFDKPGNPYNVMRVTTKEEK